MNVELYNNYTNNHELQYTRYTDQVTENCRFRSYIATQLIYSISMRETIPLGPDNIRFNSSKRKS